MAKVASKTTTKKRTAPKRALKQTVSEEEKGKKLECSCCGKSKAINKTNFYLSFSNINTARKYSQICKDCMGDIYEELCRSHGDNPVLNVFFFCQKLDMKFTEDCYKYCRAEIEEGKIDPWRIYVQKFNSIYISRFGDLDSTFDYSEIPNEVLEYYDLIRKSELGDYFEADYLIDEEIYMRWGRGYTGEDYELLEGYYKEWIYSCEGIENDINALKNVRAICKSELAIAKAQRNRDFDTARQLEKDLIVMKDKMKISEYTKSRDDGGVDPLGVQIQKIETHRPSEYFKDPKLYKDVDYIIDYIKRFFLRPMKNLLLGSKDFDKEFNLGENETWANKDEPKPTFEVEGDYSDVDGDLDE